LKVEDNGCGIDRRHLQRVFEPFFTTKKVGEGSGLGLFICRNIVNNHGGEIDVQSEAGKGTVVTIRIPVTEESNG
jgi:signal transduction histidine kinase